MKTWLAFAAFALVALVAGHLPAGQQTLWWSISGSNSVDRYQFLFVGAGTNQLTFVVSNRLTVSNTFIVPAGHWAVSAVAVTTNYGVSDPSNQVEFDLPTPITIRLNLSSADTPEGPWTIETNSPPLLVTASDPRRFYRARVEIIAP